MDHEQQPNISGSPEKEPGDWVTGEEPMTGAQASYLETLCREAGEDFDPTLTKARASELIDRLQARTGRGAGGPSGDFPQGTGSSAP